MTVDPLEQEYDIEDQARLKLMSAIPEAFADGKILWEKLRESLGDILDDDDETAFEHYGLNWPGKRKAKKVAATPSTLTLTPLKGEGTDEDSTENIFIEGDNLEVLKILYKSYKEKIKMIYIDPPYNTGNDFVYNDNFRMTEDEFMRAEGSVDEQGNKLVANKKTSGRFHANWLNMMYPRLKIARELLKEDGVIFISIDDNEVHNLRLLCDEIFGEENNIAEVPTIMNLKGNHDAFGFAETHEYFLVYAKNKEKCVLNQFLVDEEEIYNEWQEDEYGLFKKADTLRRTGQDASRLRRPKGWFPVFITDDNIVYVTNDDKPKNDEDFVLYPANEEGEELSWSWGKEKITNENYNLIVINGRNGKNIYKKQRPQLGDLPTKKPKSFFYKPEYSSSTATTQLKKLLGKKLFDAPKPIPFLEDLLIIGAENNSIIMDFFSGSGTFAHAAMNLNANQKLRTKFICIQLPEQIDKQKSQEAYKFCESDLNVNPYISEISKYRLRQASQQLREQTAISSCDLGFKVYKTTRSNHKKWGKYSITAPKEADSLFATHQHSLIDDWEYDSVMTEIVLTEGFTLTSKIETFDSVTTNQIARIVDLDKEYLLYVCLDEHINPDTIKALNMNDNDIFICLGSAIDDQNLSALHDKGRIRTL